MMCIFKMSIIMPSKVILSDLMLWVIMQHDMLRVVMLRIVICCCSECHHSDFLYSESRYAQWCYGESHYADCCGAKITVTSFG